MFLLTAFDRLKQPTPQFHFVDLAESWLHGRLDTDTPRGYAALGRHNPPGLKAAIRRVLKSGGWNDWASYRVLKLKNGRTVKGVFPYNDSQGDKRYNFITLRHQHMVINPYKDLAHDCGPHHNLRCDKTKYYVSFPPFPAVVFLPFVALVGYNFNDVIFTALNAGLNVALLFLLLQFLVQKGLMTRTRKENIILALLFGFGTVNYFSSVRGEVWYTALIMGITLNILYVRFAVGAKSPFWAGLLLALATATRTPIAFGVVFFLLEMFREGDHYAIPDKEVLGKRLFFFFLPLFVTAFVLMWYNYVRFADPFEFGHRFLQAGARPSIREHGLFSMWFLNRNLAAALTHLPVIDGVKPFIHITRNGLSFIFLCPAFVLLLWPRFNANPDSGSSPKLVFRHLLIASLFIFIPHVLYQNTGWAQFGFRFSLDFTPYLIVAPGLSGRPMKRGFMTLFVIAVIFNLFGAITFGRFNSFYYD